MALSPHEQQILAGVESLLSDDDPRLAQQFSGSPSALLRAWFPLTAAHTGLLVLSLVVLAALAAFLPGLGPVGLAVLTGVSVAPWAAVVVRAAARRG